jgi:ABC-type phosphonate transport system ATPase subunit
MFQENAVFTHPGATDDFELCVPLLEVKPGEVLAIVGRVGSGEWSLKLTLSFC